MKEWLLNMNQYKRLLLGVSSPGLVNSPCWQALDESFMKVLLIEKPLMKMEGLHSEFEGMPWKLFFISIPMLFIGILLMPFSKLFIIPALVVVCILLPSSMAVAVISRHYEDDSPNYRAARSRVYAFLHTAWVVGVYGWLSLWVVGFFAIMWSLFS